MLFSEEEEKPDRSKLEETEKTHTQKNAKKKEKLRSFLNFRNFVKRFIPSYSTVTYMRTSLKRILN